MINCFIVVLAASNGVGVDRAAFRPGPTSWCTPVMGVNLWGAKSPVRESSHCREDRVNQVLAEGKGVSARRGLEEAGAQSYQFPDHTRSHWKTIRESLTTGSYKPLPVKRVEIPKPTGGTRPLGIPIVLDRLIQQSIAQVLTPIFDPDFSDSSFGFRPRRSAKDAVRQVPDWAPVTETG